MDFVIPVCKSKKAKKEKQVIEPCQRTKKAVEQEGDGYTNHNWHTWNGSQRFGKGTGRNGNQTKNWDHPDDSIVEIGQNTEKNTEKSPGDQGRFAVTYNPVKDH